MKIESYKPIQVVSMKSESTNQLRLYVVLPDLEDHPTSKRLVTTI